jgi:hypothetical protein
LASEAEAATVPAAATPLTATQASAGPAATISAVEEKAAKTREPGERLALEIPPAESPA